MKLSPRPRGFRPRLEALEDRLVPAVADFLRTIANPAPGLDDQFGWSVAVSGDRVLVGARFDDVGGTSNAGAAYLYDAAGGSLLGTFAIPPPAADDYFG